MENKSFKINVKNGFYIGDLCYALDDGVYFAVWGENNFEDGQYTDPETKAEFAMVGTAEGDGEYESSEEGLSFPVDAGIIGIADLSICTKDPLRKKDISCGKVVPDYSGIVFIEYNDGTITVSWGDGDDYKEIDIYTGYDDHDEDEEYYDEEEGSDEEERYDEDGDYGEDEEEEDW